MPSARTAELEQISLWGNGNADHGTNAHLEEVFRRLYFHLYTNSSASRAERIIGDLSLLLLLQLTAEADYRTKSVARFLKGEASANEVLMPLLRKRFPRLVDADERFNLDDASLRTALAELAPIRISSAPAHALGDAFQALMGPRLRGDKGQFFTPRSLVRAMVEIVAPQPQESVLDPACGTGGFLAETHALQARVGGRVKGGLLGVDKDHDLARLATALVEITSKGRGTIENFNSLDLAAWEDRVGGMAQFDVILTNPPFGAKIGVRDQALLKGFDLGYQWVQKRGDGTWGKSKALLTSQDPQTLFIELCVRLLKPGGRLGIVLPEGIFGNRQHGYIWHWLRHQGAITGLLDCPRTTFQPGTDTKTNVLFFRKEHQEKKETWIGVALSCGHDRRGRTHSPDGQPRPDDFAVLGRTFNVTGPSHGSWRRVDLSVADYFVPRYYAQRRPLSGQEADLTRGAKIATLGELIREKVLALRKGHEVGSDAYGTGDVPFVRTSDLSNFEVSVDPTKSVSDEIYERYKKQQRLKPGNILMVVDGRYRIGTTALLTETSYRCVVQSHLRVIETLQPKQLDSVELLFALNLPSVKLRIRDLVFVQSTLGTLGKRILELEVPLLCGEGPWKIRVDSFREILQQRDVFLSRLRAMSSPEFEL